MATRGRGSVNRERPALVVTRAPRATTSGLHERAMDTPPSTKSAVPVVKLDASEAR